MSFRSLRLKFFLFQTTGLLVSVFLVGAVSYSLLTTSQERAQQETLTVMAEDLAGQISRLAESRADRLQQLDLLNYHKKSNELSLGKEFAYAKAIFPVLSYINKEGREEVKVVGGQVSEELGDFHQESWFQAALNNPNQVIFTGLGSWPELGEPSLQLVVARYQYFGDEFLGVVRALIPLRELAEIVTAQTRGRDGFAVLADASDHLIFSSLHPMVFDSGLDSAQAGSSAWGREVAHPASEAEVLLFAYGGDRLHGEVDGVDGILGFKPIPFLRWTVFTVLPYQTFMKVPQQLAWATVAIGGFALVAGTLLMFLLSSPILKTITQVIAQTRQVARGNLAGRIATNGQDEMMSLADSINEMTESLAQAHATTASLNRLLEGIIDPLVVTDGSGAIVKVNGALLQLLACREEEILGLAMTSFIRDDPRFVDRQGLRDLAEANGGRLENLETVATALDHSRRVPILFSCSLTRPEKEGDAGLVGIIKDITEKKEAEAKIHYLAYFDDLTGLPNRTLLMHRLEQIAVQGERNYYEEHSLVAVLFLDLDRFKVVNDTLGHDIGDQLLQGVAGRMQETLRRSDTIARINTTDYLARLGGDEFVIVLPKVDTIQGVTKVAQNIIAAMASPFQIGGHQLFSPVSIGIALYPTDGLDTQTLLKNADIAMYHAKSAGRSTFQFYNQAMDAGAKDRLAVESELRGAVERMEDFVLFYQQKWCVAAQTICGAEALIRWQHPEKGMIPPGQFIAIAEDIGLIQKMGEWALATACRQGQSWIAAGLPEMQIAVNLSSRQFLDPAMVEVIAKILAESGLPPRLLELELTESMLMESAEETIVKLHRLKGLGLTLAIDDFGTGYSSLSYLKRFPIDIVKIDRSFVKEIGQGKGDEAIIQATVAMARSLNLKVVAEGVESAEQLAFLVELGCDEIQGFYFGKPVAAADFARHLSGELAKG